MPIDKDVVTTIELIGNLILKLILGISAIVAFFMILNQVFTAPTIELKGFYALCDGLFGFCIIRVFKHYFPVKD